MAIENLVGYGADSIDDEWADGDVRHKTTVHHVYVYPVASCFVNRLDLWIKGTVDVVALTLRELRRRVLRS